jgi:hypothetical protein
VRRRVLRAEVQRPAVFAVVVHVRRQILVRYRRQRLGH